MSKLCEFHPKHFHFTCPYLLFFFFFHHHDHVHAQSSMEPVPTYITHHSWEPSVAITVGAIIFALLLMGIISIYLRRCAESHIIIATTQTLPCSCSQGITKDLLNTFPTLFYSNVRGKQALECAVCLTDFTDKDTLRLLPKCNHVFHPHCIDSWLASHVTCPVCRANLTQDSCQLAVTVSTQDEEGSGNRTEDTHSEPNHQQLCVESPISINDGTKTRYINEEQQHSTNEQSSGLELSGNSNEGVAAVVVASERNNNFSRSNSTGHSLVEQGKCVERYTLRLPEDVRRYILVNHGRSVKGLCWSDSEESYARKRLEKWVICTPPFVG